MWFPGFLQRSRKLVLSLPFTLVRPHMQRPDGPVQSVLHTADNLADKDVDSTDTDLRYMAYGARLRTALRAGHRYLAYVRSFPY